MIRGTVTASALFALLALGAGCGEDFDPYYRLTAPRVLAVRSEPVAPATGETTTLDAFVYTPPGVDVTSYQWSWCPFPGAANDGYPCLITEEELASYAGGAAAVPSYDLGTGAAVNFENSIDPAILAAVCEGMPGQPALLDCEGGFPVQIKLVVKTDASEITSVRDLRLRFDPSQPAESNPIIDGFGIDVDGTERPLESPAPIVPRGLETDLFAHVPLEASETFMTTDAEGQPLAKRERLFLSWFVESGDVDTQRTVFIEGITELDEGVLQNKWKPELAEDYPAEQTDLFLIVRDDRDGVAWTRGTVELEDAP